MTALERLIEAGYACAECLSPGLRVSEEWSHAVAAAREEQRELVGIIEALLILVRTEVALRGESPLEQRTIERAEALLAKHKEPARD